MKTIQQIALKISGMSCGGCANTVEQALAGLEGVEQAKVDHKKGTALVSYQTDKVTTADFEKAIEASGYSFAGIQ